MGIALGLFARSTILPVEVERVLGRRDVRRRKVQRMEKREEDLQIC